MNLSDRVRDITGDIRDCLDGDIPHDSMTYRGSLLYQAVEIMIEIIKKDAAARAKMEESDD